ncbi:hypothetical protein C8R46DRAFT_1264198 [Mycena filopes]|nr:hypothetical protein C8R46DRAFT_1264198 [Mycena filopes]
MLGVRIAGIVTAPINRSSIGSLAFGEGSAAVAARMYTGMDICSLVRGLAVDDAHRAGVLAVTKAGNSFSTPDDSSPISSTSACECVAMASNDGADWARGGREAGDVGKTFLEQVAPRVQNASQSASAVNPTVQPSNTYSHGPHYYEPLLALLETVTTSKALTQPMTRNGVRLWFKVLNLVNEVKVNWGIAFACNYVKRTLKLPYWHTKTRGGWTECFSIGFQNTAVFGEWLCCPEKAIRGVKFARMLDPDTYVSRHYHLAPARLSPRLSRVLNEKRRYINCMLAEQLGLAVTERRSRCSRGCKAGLGFIICNAEVEMVPFNSRVRRSRQSDNTAELLCPIDIHALPLLHRPAAIYRVKSDIQVFNATPFATEEGQVHLVLRERHVGGDLGFADGRKVPSHFFAIGKLGIFSVTWELGKKDPPVNLGLHDESELFMEGILYSRQQTWSRWGYLKWVLCASLLMSRAGPLGDDFPGNRLPIRSLCNMLREIVVNVITTEPANQLRSCPSTIQANSPNASHSSNSGA